MKKMLVIMCAMFVLTMFATVSAHGNQDAFSNSDQRIVAMDGPDDPRQPPHKHKSHKHKPQPQPPQQPDQHDPR